MILSRDVPKPETFREEWPWNLVKCRKVEGASDSLAWRRKDMEEKEERHGQ